MGGRLALAKTTITDPSGTVRKDRGIQVIGDLVRFLEGSSVVEERHGVDRVDRVNRMTWRVVMTDGGSYLVIRGKGCGCRG